MYGPVLSLIQLTFVYLGYVDVAGVLLQIFPCKFEMNHFNLHKDAFASHDEIRGLVSIYDSKGSVLCPKPRRVGIPANNPIRPMRWHMRYFFCQITLLYNLDLQLLDVLTLSVSLNNSHQAEMCDSKARAELLDIILMKVLLFLFHSFLFSFVA